MSDFCYSHFATFSCLPLCRSVAIPHPGTSYNPSKKDHEDLLQNVIEFEKKIIRKEEHLNRVTTSMFDKMTPEQRDEARRKEMSAGVKELEEFADPDVEDGELLSYCVIENEKLNSLAGDVSDPDTYKAINPPVVVKPKDKKKIRKAREQKLIQQKLLKAKLEKKKVTDIHR